MDKIASMLPRGERLVEPFVGAGSVFMNASYSDYLLADSNADLIACYRSIKSLGVPFIRCLAALFGPRNNKSEVYYDWRDEFNRTHDSTQKAALFIYLNKHGYNGLVRYNQNGRFNVPFGRYAKPHCPVREILAFSKKAPKAQFYCQDFEITMDMCEPGDIAYCDPPYVPLSATADFTTFAPGGFTLHDQERLAKKAKELAKRGVPVLISNHDTPWARELYADAHEIKAFSVRRNISCNGEKRNVVPELLALFC